MSTFELYCILKLDELRFLLNLIAVLCFSFNILFQFFASDLGYKKQYIFTGFITFLIIGFTSLTLKFVIPTTNQAALLYTLPKITNSENISKESKEIYDLAKEWLKENSEKNEKD